VRGIAGRRKLFEELAGVADGVAIKIYVPVGVIIGGGCCVELAPPPPPQPITRNTKQARVANLFQSNVIVEIAARARVFRAGKYASKSSRRVVTTGAIRGTSGKFRGEPYAAGALPLVVTETVKLAVAPFVTVTLGTLHFVPIGIPEHTNASVPLKPAPAVACRLNVAVCPALTEALKVAPAAATIVAAGTAVAFNVTICGEFAASSVMVRVVVRIPEASGANVTGMAQLAPAATAVTRQFDPATEKSPAFSPLTPIAVTWSGPVPVFETVRFCGAAVVPCVVVPGRLNVPAGFSVTTGAGGGGATPVPLKPYCWGFPTALSRTFNVARLEPTLVGA